MTLYLLQPFTFSLPLNEWNFAEMDPNLKSVSYSCDYINALWLIKNNINIYVNWLLNDQVPIPELFIYACAGTG